MNESIVHIGYALNDGYTEYVAVSIASLLKNTERAIHLHILSSHLSKENKEALLNVAGINKAQFSFYDVTLDDAEFPCSDTGYLTIETYYRLLFPSRLKDIDKLLYLDGDTIVLSDVGEIFDVCLNDYAFGMVAESHIEEESLRKQILGITASNYYQCGVCLINLPKVRELKVIKEVAEHSNQIFSALKENGLEFFADQDCVNSLYNGAVKKLPPKYNLTYNAVECGSPMCDEYSLAQWVEAVSSPVIVHFFGSLQNKFAKQLEKQGSVISVFWKEYYRYKALTTFADKKDDCQIEEYQKTEKYLMSLLASVGYLTRCYDANEWDQICRMLNKLKGKKIAIWDDGFYGRLKAVLVLLYSKKISVDYIVSSCERSDIWGIPIKSPELLAENKGGGSVILLTCPTRQKLNFVKNILIIHYAVKESNIIYLFEDIAKKYPIRYIKYMQDLLDTLNEISGQFIIYGCGEVSRAFLRYFFKNNMSKKIRCLCVSANEKEPDEVYNIPVMSIADCRIFRNDTVMIAVDERHHVDIFKNLFMNGFRNIKAITNNCHWELFAQDNIHMANKLFEIERKLGFSN